MSDCSCGDGLCTDCARDMRRAILNVRQLHRPVKLVPRGLEVCHSCSEVRVSRNRAGDVVDAQMKRVGVAYPCATIRTLDGVG